MHLDLIESLTIAGTPGGANDDRVGLAESHAWVIDGCTDLGEPGLLGTRGGAAWIAGEADRAFAAADGDLGDICRSVFDSVAKRYESCRTREAEAWELPSAAFLAVSARDGILDCAWLGDCPAVMRSRSWSTSTANSSSTWSSMSRCWAVTQTRDTNPGSASSAATTGAILMASGRVPKTESTFCAAIGSG